MVIWELVDCGYVSESWPGEVFKPWNLVGVWGSLKGHPYPDHPLGVSDLIWLKASRSRNLGISWKLINLHELGIISLDSKTIKAVHEDNTKMVKLKIKHTCGILTHFPSPSNCQP